MGQSHIHYNNYVYVILYAFLFACIYVGTDRPALKFLNRYVRPEITGKWHDIGVELFDIEDEVVLNTIKTNNPGDADKCAAEMFQLWRERQSDSCWNQLIQALRAPSIRLETLALKIEGMLCEGMYVM